MNKQKEDIIVDTIGNCIECRDAVVKKQNSENKEYIDGHQFKNGDAICDDCLHELAIEKGYGYCDDCDERVPDEGMNNEGYY